MLHVVEKGHPRLVCLLTKHVDDVKITGEREYMTWVLKQLEDTFGKMKLQWHEFTNCGVRHIQDKVSKAISLDQIEYANNLQPITHSELTSGSPEELCSTQLHELYRSLLGAVAYLYLTRMDALVFIVACQRFGHQPKRIHVKRLNVIVRWIKRNPRKLWCKPFGTLETHLRIVSDASFKKEEDKDKGHGLRGSTYLRACGNSLTSFSADSTVHILEFLTKALRHVTRSTFSSELHALCDTADLGILLALLFHEIHSGPVTKAKVAGFETKADIRSQWSFRSMLNQCMQRLPPLS